MSDPYHDGIVPHSVSSYSRGSALSSLKKNKQSLVSGGRLEMVWCAGISHQH